MEKRTDVAGPTSTPNSTNNVNEGAEESGRNSQEDVSPESGAQPSISSSEETAAAPPAAASSSPVEENDDENTNAEAPLIPERKRNQFSYSGNELRRRHTADKKSESGEPSHATTTTTSSSSPSGGGFYECNICFDTATHPVLTVCGHLFCWSCLAQWLNAQARNPTCPVCKAGCGKDKVIPVYGRGREEKDPRTDPSIPTRPAGQRPPPLRDPNVPTTSFFGQPLRGAMYNAGGNVSISAGIGIFPFGITFNIPTTTATSTTGLHGGQTPQSAFMSRLILMVISLIIVAIVFY